MKTVRSQMLNMILSDRNASLSGQAPKVAVFWRALLPQVPLVSMVSPPEHSLRTGVPRARSRALQFCLAFWVSLFASVALGQVDNVYVYGTVKDYVSSKKLDGITVTVFKNGGKLTEVVTNASGKYEFNLDYGSDYKLVYGKAGMVSKNISIDTKNIPEEERVGGHGMNVEMTLFAELPGIDFSVLQQPIGKAKFDPNTKEVTWDLQYTEQVRAEIARLMKEYDEKKKREANADAEFAKLMTAGDAAMAAAGFDKAVENFTAALGLKPGDPVATAKLSDAKMKQDEAAGAKKAAEQYAALIKEADGLFGKKDYAGALAKYGAASDMKEAETYPKQKMKECQAFIDELAKKAEEEKKARELEEKYKAAITAADAAFKADKLEDARTKYTDASALKPTEKYPKDQIALIGQKLEEKAKKEADEKAKKERDAAYQAAITAADAAFKASKWDDAKAKYNEAIGVKPEEKYPKDQLAAIDKAIADAAKKAEEEKQKKELDDKYNAAIAKADAAFKQDGFDDAKAGYNEALGLKPKEKYPSDQLAAIDKRMAELAKKAEEDRLKKELDDKYNAAITKADAAFQGQNWVEAKAGYNEALGLKAGEKYPKDQLAAIEAAKKKAEEDKLKKEQDDKYNAAIAKADAAFQGQKWDDAKAGYNEALGVKAGERYPKDQLAAIDKAIADAKKQAEEAEKQRQIDAQYELLIGSADGLLRQDRLEEAKAKYQEALGVKPDQKYPRTKITEIDGLLAERAKAAEEERKRKELDDRYNALIASADKAFDKKTYPGALNDYKDALALKPGEAHPTARIAEINGLLDAAARDKAEQERLAREAAEREKHYNELIAAADGAFKSKEYDRARSGYTDALGVKPGEKHPTDRLAEIERILADLAAKDAADAAEKARLEEERRRKEAADAETEARYREAVARGDAGFSSESFDAARSGYNDALGIKPDEAYPKERLAAIDKLLADRERAKSDADAAERARLEAERLKREADAAALEARYKDAIAKGDIAFDADKLEDARARYTEALAIKPGGSYPQERIAAIDQLLVDRERAKLDADAAEAERRRLEEERRRKAEADAEAARLAALDEQARLDAEKAREAAYLKTIAEADAAFGKEEYDNARGLYTQALDAKPEEIYPRSQIEKIAKLLEEIERKRREAELAAERKEQPPPPKRGSRIDQKEVSDAEEFMRAARLREEQEKYERIKKLKADVSDEERSNVMEQAERQSGSMRQNRTYEDDNARIYAGSDAMRKKYEEELAAQRAAWAQQRAQVEERGARSRGAAEAGNEALVTANTELDRTWRDRHTERVNLSATEKEQWVAKQADVTAGATSRRDQASAEVAGSREGRSALAAKGNATAGDRANGVITEKEQYMGHQRQLANRAEDARMSAKEQLENMPVNEQRSFSDYNRGELANQYPQGVTEESYTEGNKVIIRRIVVQGNKADDYKKVIGKAGTSYFKNGMSITSWLWTRETEE